MSDIRAPDTKEQAKQDYLKGMKYKDLAEKYNVSLNTIKSWVKRYEWSKEKKKGAHKNKKGCTQNKIVCKEIKEPKLEEVTEVINNSELTDKQRLFCIYYIKYFNGTKAAIKAGYSKDTATEQGSRLLSNVKVQAEIKRLKAAKFKGAFLEKEDLLQKYIDIAFADITDFLEFGQKEVPLLTKDGKVVLDKEGNQVTQVFNTVSFIDSSEVDGTIIEEVSQGKSGAKLKLQDKMKALDFLSKHIGLLDVDTKEKLKLAKDKFELEKAKINKDDDKNKGEMQVVFNIPRPPKDDEKCK